MKKKIFLFFKSPIGILLIAGLVLRIILYFIFQPYNYPQEVLFQDAEGYHQLAIQFLKDGNFIINNSTLDTLRTPGYPLFIWAIYLIFGIKFHIVLFIQIFINLASIYILYLIGGNVFNKKIGFIAALLFSLELDHLYFVYSLLTETLFIFLFLLSSLYFIYFFKKGKQLYLILSSILLGLATLVRPIAMFLPFILIFGLLIYQIRYKSLNFKDSLRYIFLIIFFFSLTISPWLIRNYSRYGYAQLSSISGNNLLNCNVAITIQNSENRSILDVRRELDSLILKKDTLGKLGNPFYKSKVQTEVAMEFINKHKTAYFKTHFLGILNIYITLSYKEFSHRFFRINNDLYVSIR